MATRSEPIDFRPVPAMLAAAIDELEDLGGASGSAVPAPARRAALAAYLAFGPEPERMPAAWRHDYAALPFEDLEWSSGRVRVPALPPAASGTAGLVHSGSIYLQPAAPAGGPGLTLRSLADAKRRLGLVPAGSDRFVALATAFQNCGAYVHVAAGTTIEEPVQLVWSERPGPGAAVFPHVLIELEAGARVTVVERVLGGGDALVCGIVEATLGPGAHLDYVGVQQADDGVRLFMRRAARCGEGASIGWHLADLGGALVRDRITAELDGPGGQATAHAFFFGQGYDNADLDVRVDHAAPATRSRVVVRSGASDHSVGRFTGTIRMERESAGSDASLRDDALLLSRTAYLDAVPILEIECNDVRAAHGATVGSLDEDALFYVQSRGVPREVATRMMALAFFEPAIAGFPTDALRDEVRTALDERLDAVPDTFIS